MFLRNMYIDKLRIIFIMKAMGHINTYVLIAK